MKPGLLKILDRLYELPNEDFEELIQYLNDFKLIKKCVAKYNNSNNVSEKEAKPTKKNLEDWKKIFKEAQYDKDFKIITNTPITIDYIGDTCVYKIHGKETKDLLRVEEVLNKLNKMYGIFDSSKSLKPNDKISEYWEHNEISGNYILRIINATKLEEKFISEIVKKLYSDIYSEKHLIKIISEQFAQNCLENCIIKFLKDSLNWQNIIVTVK